MGSGRPNEYKSPTTTRSDRPVIFKVDASRSTLAVISTLAACAVCHKSQPIPRQEKTTHSGRCLD